VFAVVNNQYGMGTRIDRASASLRFVERAETFGVRGAEVDGMDVEAVFRAARELFAHSREGNGPGFLIANCYRFYGHGRKDPSPYRAKSEEEAWRKKDPIELEKTRLVGEGVLDEEKFQGMTREVAKEMDDAVVFASNGHVPEPADLFTHVYAD
jgi:pyruvate dehydrogenase E1 component alpha subunit